MVYVVVDVDEATGSAHVVQLRLVVGDQLYDSPLPDVVPPETVEFIVPEFPEQIVISGPAVNEVGFVQVVGQTTLTVNAPQAAPPYPSTCNHAQPPAGIVIFVKENPSPEPPTLLPYS
jgi:hypothetical protein